MFVDHIVPSLSHKGRSVLRMGYKSGTAPVAPGGTP